MRRTPLALALLVVGAVMGVSRAGAAQDAARPTILNVTMDAAGDQLTITGTGFGPAPVVTIDGQPVPVLTGATDVQVTVVTPAALLITPGTYRLTVLDSVRQVGEVFVVASRAGLVPAVSLTTGEKSEVASGAGIATAQPRANTAASATSSGTSGGPVGIFTVIEDSADPFRTALGYQALAANTTGTGNTATGYQALAGNTTGNSNTADGGSALLSNISGTNNTASGSGALFSNTTGNFNTASGTIALFSNTTGCCNTASGYRALRFNTTGHHNTASGVEALYSNTTGSYNTASGFEALNSNTSGDDNTASGPQALYSNTTGFNNTASGFFALYSNTTGSNNTASGLEALYYNTTGTSNTALGTNAGLYATAGNYNLFLGADVYGTDTDTNTIRIGSAYNGENMPAIGQNQTFVAGIRGTTISGGFPVVIDTNGQLGTADGSGDFGIGTMNPTAKLDVRGAGIAPALLRLVNTSPGGGQFLVDPIGGSIGSLVAGDALVSNGVGNIVFSPNAAGKDVRFIGGVWTNPISMTVADGGNVGVGTTTPGAKLEVSTSGIAPPSFNVVNTNAGGGRFGVNVIGGAIGSLQAGDALMQNGVGNIVFSPNAGGKDVRFIGGVWTNPVSLVVKDGGNVGIGTLSPSFPLHMASGAYVSAGGVWTNASSRTLKEQIAELPADRALDAFARLRPVTFVYKASPGEAHVGFIAEDVPDLVATTDRKSLAAMDIVAVLTKVVQDQQATIADLQARLARLERWRTDTDGGR